MENKGIEINKGTYSIDTEERRQKYMAARAYGHEDEFYEYRRKWDSVGKDGVFEVFDYPLSIEFGISDVCNLKCEFCYRSQPDYKPKAKKYMEFDTFKKVIDEVGGKVPAVRFNSSGESVMNRDFIKMVKYAKDHGAIEVSFITNSGLIDRDVFEKLLLAGVDWISVSVDGMGETYNKLRYPLKFEDTYNRLKMMKELKEYYNTPKPAINIQAIWPFIEDNADEFIDTMSGVCDYINYSALIDREYKHSTSEHESGFMCPYPFQRLLIHPDGSAKMCCNAPISIGNVNEESVYDIWNGEKLNNVRDRCSTAGGYLDIPSCRGCIVPVKMIGETRIVKGEKKTIFKYIYNAKSPT